MDAKKHKERDGSNDLSKSLFNAHNFLYTCLAQSRLLHLKSTFLFCPPNKFKTPTIQYTAASVNIHSTKTSFSVLSCLPTCANQGE